MAKTATSICGHAAEHLVCYDLARRGLSAASNVFEGAPYDIIADYNGNLIRIQVKGTQRSYLRRRQRKSCVWEKLYYKFSINESQIKHNDIIAFVAADLETIIYKHASEIAKTPTGVTYAVDVMQAGSDAALLELLSNLDNL